jgi:FkbM family methyltransferase
MSNWFRKFKRKKQLAAVSLNMADLQKMEQMPTGQQGSILIENKPFEFHDALSFYVTYQEIFVEGMYEFNTQNPQPYILDCGANMGLSVLYFSRLYPKAEIVAFEPEQPIYEMLKRNINTFINGNISVKQLALWNKKTELNFYTDKGMGGSIENTYSNQQPVKIQTELLSTYINKPVDFLKLDIEGAETEVLLECKDKLHLVKNIFVEYHSFINKPQQLDVILNLLSNAGFRYHIKESFVRRKPFIDKALACENMDMAITVFAYRD